MIKSVEFPIWPTWNFHFAELDVSEITSVKYFDAAGEPHEYPLDKVRLTCGHNGVSGITFKEKHALPKLEPRTHEGGVAIGRADAVTVTYDCPAEPQGLLTNG